ncbi:hypothetical protein [Reyranella massiliensis]|uniref:hypothetical protein n=1 Tax=Reyranella massiliensis TaxID=445220 RepID=UPI0005C28570|nr:hypothetical protein [Reyranella massiliensis]
MPDTFFSGDFSGTSVQPFPMSPTELVNCMVDAVQSATDDKGDIVSKPKAVKALLPLIGTYTVADAAMVLPLFHGALAVWPALTDEGDECPRFNTLCHVSWLLEEFACLAEASGPLCITGRLYLLEQAAADDAWALPHPVDALRRTRNDTMTQSSGRFSRETFGGLETKSGVPSWLHRAQPKDGDVDYDELRNLFGTPRPQSN